MAIAHYPYLLSSLPMLHFGSRPPITMEAFMRTCRELVPQGDLAILEAALSGDIHLYSGSQDTLKRYASAERDLRNELVRLRSVRKKQDPALYLRPGGGFDTAIHIAATNAVRNPYPLDGEKALDLARWNALDTLEMGHFFDIDALIIYAIRLSILTRWERIRRADKRKELESALA